MLSNYIDSNFDFLVGIIIQVGRFLLLGIGNFADLFIKLRGRHLQCPTFRATAGRTRFRRFE